MNQIAAVRASEFWEYLAKCLLGVSIGYGLYKGFPEYSGETLWVLISILLSITHDNNSQVAYDRMRGNIVGSTVGLLAFFLANPPNLLTICLGVAITIGICFQLRLLGVVRTALVAFVIVLFYEQSHSSWSGALYRMASVVLGCLIGLVINFAFRKLVFKLYPARAASLKKSATTQKPDGGE